MHWCLKVAKKKKGILLNYHKQYNFTCLLQSFFTQFTYSISIFVTHKNNSQYTIKPLFSQKPLYCSNVFFLSKTNFCCWSFSLNVLRLLCPHTQNLEFMFLQLIFFVTMKIFTSSALVRKTCVGRVPSFDHCNRMITFLLQFVKLSD